MTRAFHELFCDGQFQATRAEYSWWSPPRTGRETTSLGGTGRTGGNQRADRWLHAKSAMGSAMIVTNVLLQHTVGVYIVDDNDVVEAIAA